MKNISKTEQKVIDKVGYNPVCGKFDWNYETKKYDKLNPEWVKRCRARVQKLMRENDAKTPGQLLKIWERQARIDGQSALELFKASPKFKAMQKLPAFVRVELLPATVEGKHLSTSYIKMYRDKQGQTPDYVRRVIESASYEVADWGRLRKTYVGSNNFYCHGIRTETNGKWGKKMVSWHYADYYIAVNPDITKAFYKLANGERGTFCITRNGSFKFSGRIYRKPKFISSETGIKPHHIRRSAEKVLRGNIRFEWDRKERSGMFVDNLTGEQYHFQPATSGTASTSLFYQKMFRNALDAFRKRRREKARREHYEKVKNFMLHRKEQIFVSICDSTRAGNCKFGTDSFVKSKLNIDPEKVGAVTVGRILEQREDNFTLRACAEAAERYIRQHQIQLS